MKDPSLAIQGAENVALRASAAVKALAGDPARVFDKVVPDPGYPFVRIGEHQLLDDSDGCNDAWELVSTIHVFSRHPEAPRVEAKRLLDACLRTLVSATPIAPAGFVVTDALLEQSRTFMDADGITAHGVLAVRYFVDDNS